MVESLSEAQLAHVVIVARPHAASSLDEGSSTFRAVRRRLIVGFPHDDDVVDYLQTPAGGGLPATAYSREMPCAVWYMSAMSAVAGRVDVTQAAAPVLVHRAAATGRYAFGEGRPRNPCM